MGFMTNYITYLENDAKEDRALKTMWRVAIRLFMILLLRIMVELGWVTFNNSDLILGVITALNGILILKDVIVDNIPKLSKFNAFYNLLIEGLVILSIIPVNLLYNLYTNAYSLTKIEPSFIVAVALNFLVMAFLNIGLAVWKKKETGFIANENLVFLHNGLIIAQTIVLLMFGLSLYGALDYSDFYSEILALRWL